jgi:hypothetical protein
MSTTEAQTDNMGGLQKIWPIALTSVGSFADIFDAELHVFTLIAGTSADPLYVIRDTLKFKQEKKVTADGTYFDTKLEADVPKDRIELQKLMELIDVNNYIVLIQDNNGQYKVIGTPDEPMNFEAELDAGQIESALNCYKITFTRKLRFRSPFIDTFPIIGDPE